MKKNLKKVLSLVLALAMVFAMSVTVSADTDTCTITINGAADGAVYSAYKLMDVADLGSNSYEYTVNTKYSKALANALTAVSASTTDAVEYLSDSQITDAEVRAFADAVYAQITTLELTADATSTSSTITAEYGYYLIAETTTGSEADTYSLVMLNTVASSAVSISTKEDTPTMTKQLVDVNDSTDDTTIDDMVADPTTVTDWQDTADYDYGDTVLFKLEGTVSSYYADYEEYYYAFHDSMCDGLRFNSSSVQVYVLNDSNYTKITSGYTIVTNCTDDCTFEVVFDDLKDVASVSSTSKIVVYYTATLTGEDVVYGNPGNENEAYLVYSNNPYFDGNGTTPTGKTPKDGVIVFTYYLEITKTDQNGNALNGATFTLKKYNASSEDWDTVDTISGTASSVFTFSGLDDGYYVISEDVVPSGYNGISPIYFTVKAGHTTTVNPWAFSSTSENLETLTATTLESATAATLGITATGTLTLGTAGTSTSTGAIAVTVENTAGSLLPTTGGIGTTIFYIVGVILVLGAGVLLVTRRRAVR